jgi:hypothetical protein
MKVYINFLSSVLVSISTELELRMLNALVLGMECHNIYSLKFMHVGVTQKRIIIAVVWAINIK